MTFTVYQDRHAFMEAAVPYLEQSQEENNLPLGILSNPSRHTFQAMAIYFKKKIPAAVFLQTASHNQMTVAVLQPLSDDDILTVVKAIHSHFKSAEGFIGEKATIDQLSEQWTALYKMPVKEIKRQRIYKLTAVNISEQLSTQLRLAETSDLEVAAPWVHAFSTEVGFPMDKEKNAKAARQMVEEKRLHLLEDEKGSIVSMASITRPVKDTITINYVYTPPEHRQKGFASRCVALLSKKMLDLGYRSTNLYTDLDNPTSNKIYTAIGYKPVTDVINLTFDTRFPL